MEKALKAARAMKGGFSVRNEELLLHVGFFSLEQRQPGLLQRSAGPGVACREQAGISCSMPFVIQDPEAISVEAGRSQGQPEQKKGFLLQWTEILPKG